MNITNLISIEGPPGSGKTIIGAEVTRRLVEKTKEETGEEPVVIFTSVPNKEDSPLGSLLKSSAEQMGGKFVPWLELLEENRVERVKLERNKNYDNLAEQIASLGEKLAAEAGGRKTQIIKIADFTM